MSDSDWYKMEEPPDNASPEEIRRYLQDEFLRIEQALSVLHKDGDWGINSVSGEFDNLFDVPVSIDVAHHEVHEGDSYVITHYDEDAANNHLVQIYFKTPAVTSPQKRMHMVISHGGSGAHAVYIDEGVTYTSGGADHVPINRHRASVKTSGVQACKIGSTKASNPIIYSGNDVIWIMQMGAGKSQGMSGRGTTEWILASNTEYLIAIESGATSTAIALELDWYEHTDKE